MHLQQGFEYRLCGLHAVHGGGHDAAGIACALSGGVQAHQLRLTPFIPDDADRGGAPGLGARQDGIGIGKALQALVQVHDAFFQIVGDAFRQDRMQVAPVNAGQVGGPDGALAGAGSALQEIAEALGGSLIAAGEGAGYAGGIMSAAVDGMEAAEAVLKDLL